MDRSLMILDVRSLKSLYDDIDIDIEESDVDNPLVDHIQYDIVVQEVAKKADRPLIDDIGCEIIEELIQ